MYTYMYICTIYHTHTHAHAHTHTHTHAHTHTHTHTHANIQLTFYAFQPRAQSMNSACKVKVIGTIEKMMFSFIKLSIVSFQHIESA
jgi:ABC-type Zn2+ transport system substrate-binding protein/surface adhesin